MRGVRRSHSSFLLLATLALASCAEGQVDDGEGGNTTPDDAEVDAGADDVQIKASDDVVIPPEDVVTTPEDAATPPEDVVVSRPDVPTGVDAAMGVDVVMGVDVPVGFDVVTVPDDRPTAMDVLVSRDVVTARDVVSVDVPAADSGVTCAAPRSVCAGRCVDTATDAAHCGACGIACTGATPACAASRCVAATCGAGTSNCDGNTANGCEVSHRSADTCAAAPNLGAWCGDVGCGFLCPSTSSRVVATRTGLASAWFRGRTNECSSCPARLEVTFTLTVPPGVDYDLYVHDGCGGAVLGSSLLLAGQTDRVSISRSGDLGSDNFNWWVEVRYLSGASCSPWTLTVQTRSGSASSC